VDDIRAAIDELIACRFVMRIGSYLGILARALLRQNRIDDARRAIAEALDYQERQGERWCRPELLRIDAATLLHAGETQRGEARLQDALTESREIGAKMIELRAATELAAHWIASGRRKRAASLLSPIYHKFTEGFQTPDLISASQTLRCARAR
jgi:predicted ATPase